MKKRRYKQFENKIKEAANSLQPDFDEHAWNRMELLLDKEKPNRPFIWWWSMIAFLLITLFIVYIIIQPRAETKRNSIKIKKEQILSDQKITIPEKKGQLIQSPETNNPFSQIHINTPVNRGEILTISKPTNKIDQNKIGKNDQIKPGLLEKPGVNKYPHTGFNTNDESKPAAKKENTGLPPGAIAEKIKTLKTEKSKSKKPERLKWNSFFSKIYISGNTGLDGAGLRLFSFSDKSLAIKSGFGLGYQINTKFNIETGFYFGTKKYIAGPNDYKYEPGSYWSTVDLIKVDANCIIYEIPLLLQYTISQNPKTRYYAGAGLVSFIMKKEDYNYDYFSYGVEHTFAKSFHGNNHLFSSFQFSVGVERKLTEKLSLIATPSISIPLNGVGNGKVKLYSTSLQAGVKYFPFKNKK